MKTLSIDWVTNIEDKRADCTILRPLTDLTGLSRAMLIFSERRLQ